MRSEPGSLDSLLHVHQIPAGQKLGVRSCGLKNIDDLDRQGTDSDRYYDADEFEFLLAMDRFKREQNKPFPSWSEALGVLKSLGWRKGG